MFKHGLVSYYFLADQKLMAETNLLQLDSMILGVLFGFDGTNTSNVKALIDFLQSIQSNAEISDSNPRDALVSGWKTREIADSLVQITEIQSLEDGKSRG